MPALVYRITEVLSAIIIDLPLGTDSLTDFMKPLRRQ
jgi:hypothetical protein